MTTTKPSPASLKLIQSARRRQTPSLMAQLEARWKARQTAARIRHAEEAADRAERQRRKMLAVSLEEEALFYMHRIVGVTARMSNLSYHYKKNERDLWESRVKTIRFSDMVLQPEAIYLRVNTVELPNNVSIESLTSPEALYNYSMSCGHKVLCEAEPERGLWFIIERSIGVRGIPGHVRIDEMWSMRGPSHDSLAIPLGLGENKKPIWRSLTQMLSILCGGTPGSGKTNLYHVALCTLIRFNSPHRLKLALIDLKNGVAMGPYAEVPHIMQYRPMPLAHKEDALEPEIDNKLPIAQIKSPIQNENEGPQPSADLQPAVIERAQDVLPLLRAIYREGRRRLRLIREAGEWDIGNYNWKHPKRALPHILLLVDELAEMGLLSPREHSANLKLLASIAQLFRAAGIHVLCATQTATKEVITLPIINSLPAHIAFNCSNVTASTLIIGNGRAVDLAPKGRCILDWNGRQLEIQTPYMPQSVVRSIIEGAIRGEYEEFELKKHDVTEEDIFRVAVEEFAGRLPADELYRWFANQQRHIPRQEVREIIQHYLDQEVLVNGTLYRLHRGSGIKPPFLIAAEEHGRKD